MWASNNSYGFFKLQFLQFDFNLEILPPRITGRAISCGIFTKPTEIDTFGYG